MDNFNIVVIALMLIGFIFIVYAIVCLSKMEKPKASTEVDESIKQVRTAVDKADLAMDDLNVLAEKIFDQFDEKQKELLFLYEQLERKALPDEEKENSVGMKNPIKRHPRLPQIKELLKKGKSTDEIAKELEMGKGEVALIVELGKELL